MDEMNYESESSRDIIKEKLRRNFDGKIVRKDLTKRIKEGANVPVYVLESSVRLSVLIWSMIMFPFRFWFVAVNMTFPPLEPVVPHWSCPLASKSIPLSKFSVQLFRFIIDSVFVMWNIGAVLAYAESDAIVSLLFVAFSVAVPTSASPLILW